MTGVFRTGLLSCIKYIELCGPFAFSHIKGSYKYPDIFGTVEFYELKNGVFIVWEINGIPFGKWSVHGFHIHDGVTCGGCGNDAFPESGSHLDKSNNAHPYHSGDLPPLFSNNGYAFGSVLTDRITKKDILNKTIIIHSAPDDFTTQPSGNSGEKIACGVITPI
ncbi:MAG: superoxide dismutase family protein [Lachnospiraceae bacterium]|nr:superoxide dismutase family protein [Lachnospiraceae bacterium]